MPRAALIAQLFTDLRADELDTLDHCRVIGTSLAQRLGNLSAQLRVFTRHAHQQVGCGAEALYNGFVIARRNQLLTDLAEVGGTLVGQLDERTAGEVQTKVEPFMEPAEQRQCGKEHRDGERNIANAHEVDGT
ncbi:hypothetical protein ABIC14_002223 [Pseudomonas sp. PvP046]